MYPKINPLNPELNPICYLLALLGALHFLHVRRIRVKLLTFRLLMSYIYMQHPFLMFLDHTQRRSTVGRAPLDEWSARRRDFYLTTHDTHNRQISIPPGGNRTQYLSGDMDICLLWVSFVVRYRSLRRADHSSRGVLPTVLRRCVWSRNIKNGCSIYIWH